MRPPGVTRLTGPMPSELPPDTRPKSTRRTSNAVMTLVVTAALVLTFLALLPVIGTIIVVVLWASAARGATSDPAPPRPARGAPGRRVPARPLGPGRARPRWRRE